MTQAAKRPSTATRRTGGSQPALNGHGPRGEQDLVGDRDRDDGNDRDERTEDRDERTERNSDDEQSEQRARRDDREDRDVRNERVERDSRDEQSDQRQRTERGEQRHGERGEQRHGDRGELGEGREPRREPGGVQRSLEQVTDRARSATSTGGDALAPTADLSKALEAWFDMVGDMMKLQQQFFSSVLGAGNTDDPNTKKV